MIKAAAVALIAAPLIGGLVSSMTMDLTWYKGLRKPAWTPPSWLFGPAWTVLYVLMGVASYLVLSSCDKSSISNDRSLINWALWLYVAQLLLNWTWTPVFFGAHRPDIAFTIIIAMWAIIVTCAVLFWKIVPLAGALMIPYVAWVSFAAALNLQVYRLNYT